MQNQLTQVLALTLNKAFASINSDAYIHVQTTVSSFLTSSSPTKLQASDCGKNTEKYWAEVVAFFFFCARVSIGSCLSLGI